MSNIVPSELTESQITLLKDTIAKGADDNQLKLFLHMCNKTQLDPFAKQIYFVLREDKKNNTKHMTIQSSIDGLRLVAERSGKYAGQVGPYWCGTDGNWKDVWLEKGYPFAAKVGIKRKDFDEPLWAVARFDAYAQKKYDGNVTMMWDKMPDIMIAKCAEALALRKGFPMELSGLVSSEEMAQADNPPQVYVKTLPERKESNTNEIQAKSPDVSTKDPLQGPKSSGDDLPYDWGSHKVKKTPNKYVGAFLSDIPHHHIVSTLYEWEKKYPNGAPPYVKDDIHAMNMYLDQEIQEKTPGIDPNETV